MKNSANRKAQSYPGECSITSPLSASTHTISAVVASKITLNDWFAGENYAEKRKIVIREDYLNSIFCTQSPSLPQLTCLKNQVGLHELTSGLWSTT